MTDSDSQRQLLILRHGKSDWSVDADDFHRPLKRRGRTAAKKIGCWLKEQNLVPDRVISSPAVRALTTAELAVKQIDGPIIETDDRIYEASREGLLKILAELNNEKRPMLVGHNPGLESLLHYLSEIDEKFFQGWKLLTTGTVAVVNMPQDWTELGQYSARLVELVRGRNL